MLEKDTVKCYSKSIYYRLFASFGLAGIVYALSTGNFLAFGALLFIPLFLIVVINVLNRPILLLYLIFGFNYFNLGLTRYFDLSGISVLMDALLVTLLLIIFINGALLNNIDWKSALNTLSAVSFLWMIYCIIEIINPTGVVEAWVLSRNLIFNGFLVAVIASLVIKRHEEVKTIILLYSIFTLSAVFKTLMQKYIGFDFAEQRWLDEGGAKTHIIISGVRYFSFFTDAGNLGSNMGCAATIFTILAFYTKKRAMMIYFLIVAALALLAMFMSGTRGAIIVPLGGLALYSFTSKNFKSLTASSILLVGIYVFFAFTTIGQSNDMIRRMRTSFNPTEDPSFNVRAENKKKLGEYLKNKPFGEGLGLSGVENQKLSQRFTTEIPHDSWYVKLWVETGIVGLMLYVAGLIAVVIRCAYIIMFKIKNKKFKGMLTALLCGVFGLMLSAYGNAFFGQYPTMIIVYIYLAIILNGEKLEETIEEKVL